jgi:hypothetical protein
MHVGALVRLRSKEIAPMHIEQDERGDYGLEATALGPKFSISADELRRRMRLGFVTSRVEVGDGEHAGLRRLTVCCGAEVWRATINADDQIVTEELGGEPALSRLVRRAARAL